MIKNNGKLETLYVGDKKAPVQCRMYDKGLEREKAGALEEYLKSVNLTAIPEGKIILRIEFQIRRPFLNEHKLKGLDQLPGSATIAWEYLTKDWLRVVKKKSKTNAAREENEDWWEVVKEALGHNDFKLYKKDPKKKLRIDLGKLTDKIFDDLAQLLAQSIIVKKPSCRDLGDHEINLQKGFDVWGELWAIANCFRTQDVDGDFRGRVKAWLKKLIGNRKVTNVRRIPDGRWPDDPESDDEDPM